MATSKVAVIIAAAGKGERFGGDGNKTFAKLGGRPVFLRTIEHFINRDDVCQTIFVANPSDMDELTSKYEANLAFMGVSLTKGGATRLDSVAAGLKLVSEEADFVAVHDAVRPCVTTAMIDAVFEEASKSGAAILAAPVTGTLKRASEASVIEETVSRANLFEAQTPQVFRKSLLLDIHQNLPSDDVEITDDAQLCELAGHPVAIVRSDRTNLKITTRSDITLANAILKTRPSDKPTRQLGAFEEAQW